MNDIDTVAAIKNIQHKIEKAANNFAGDEDVIMLIKVPHEIRDRFQDKPWEALLTNISMVDPNDKSVLRKINLEVIVIPDFLRSEK